LGRAATACFSSASSSTHPSSSSSSSPSASPNALPEDACCFCSAALPHGISSQAFWGAFLGGMWSPPLATAQDSPFSKPDRGLWREDAPAKSNAIITTCFASAKVPACVLSSAEANAKRSVASAQGFTQRLVQARGFDWWRDKPVEEGVSSWLLSATSASGARPDPPKLRRFSASALPGPEPVPARIEGLQGQGHHPLWDGECVRKSPSLPAVSGLLGQWPSHLS
jgi:hypothetical protein